jgi:hypothetical protein
MPLHWIRSAKQSGALIGCSQRRNENTSTCCSISNKPWTRPDCHLLDVRTWMHKNVCAAVLLAIHSVWAHCSSCSFPITRGQEVFIHIRLQILKESGEKTQRNYSRNRNVMSLFFGFSLTFVAELPYREYIP